MIDVDGAAQALRQFAEERDWQQFHSPKNLVMALSGEVGELTEIFQWMSEADSHTAASVPKTAHAVRDELADVALYLIRLADVLGVDLTRSHRQQACFQRRRVPRRGLCAGVSTEVRPTDKAMIADRRQEAILLDYDDRDIEDLIHAKYQAATRRKVAGAEIRSRRESPGYIARVGRDSAIADDVSVAVEFILP